MTIPNEMTGAEIQANVMPGQFVEMEIPDGYRQWDSDIDTSTDEKPTLDLDRVLVGPLGQYLEAVDAHTEATLPAIGMGLLANIGTYLGRSLFVSLGRDSLHYPNLYVAVVGPTSKGRKGMADSEVRWMMRNGVTTDLGWSDDHRRGGFGSGEKFIQVLRDAEYDEGGDLVRGREDQRILVSENELARIFTVANKEGSTLSEVLRQGYDNDVLRHETLERGSIKSSNASVGVFGSITPAELQATMKAMSISNGFGNRFIFGYSESDKHLPFGSDGGQQELMALAWDIGGNLKRYVEDSQPTQMAFVGDARDRWPNEYERLNNVQGSPTVIGLTHRGYAHVTRMALNLAALDGADNMENRHLDAALAWWDYAEATVRFIFGSHVGIGRADDVLGELRSAGVPMTRTEIVTTIGKNRITGPETDQALQVLVERNLIATFKAPSTGGRRPEIAVAIARDTGN